MSSFLERRRSCGVWRIILVGNDLLAFASHSLPSPPLPGTHLPFSQNFQTVGFLQDEGTASGSMNRRTNFLPAAWPQQWCWEKGAARHRWRSKGSGGGGGCRRHVETVRSRWHLCEWRLNFSCFRGLLPFLSYKNSRWPFIRCTKLSQSWDQSYPGVVLPARFVLVLRFSV